MGAHNQLPSDALKTQSRMFVWLLVIFGYMISMAMAADTSGWDDPVFTIVRKVPYTPYSWAALLALTVSIYTLGEFMSDHSRFRGRIVILGSLLVFMWFIGMALCMARMVYVMPTRITVLWPLVTMFIAMLYATRIVVYANAFTGERWNTDPHQLWPMLFVLSISISQIVIGVAPGTIFTEIEHPAQLQVAICNFVGAAVIMFGLHLQNQERGLVLELSGGIILVFTLSWYGASVLRAQTLAGTTLGFGLVEATVFATLHRSIQILTLQLADWRGKTDKAVKLKQALTSQVIVERDHEYDYDAPSGFGSG